MEEFSNGQSNRSINISGTLQKDLTNDNGFSLVKKNVLKSRVNKLRKVQQQGKNKMNQVGFLRTMKTSMDIKLNLVQEGYPKSKVRKFQKLKSKHCCNSLSTWLTFEYLWLVWDLIFIAIILPSSISYSIKSDYQGLLASYQYRHFIYFIVVAFEISFNFFRIQEYTFGSLPTIKERIITALIYLRGYFWWDILMILPIEFFGIGLTYIIWILPFLPIRQYLRLAKSMKRLINRVSIPQSHSTIHQPYLMTRLVNA